MDLGAGICTPRRPSCLVCPVQSRLRRRRAGHRRVAAAAAGARRAAAARRLRLRGAARGRPRAAAQARRGGAARRHAGGARTAWGDLLPPAKEALRSAPVRADWWAVPGTVVHVVHALPAGGRRLSRAGAGGCDAHLLGRARALPLGGAPRSARGRRAERHAQGHRPRAAGELARPLRRSRQQLEIHAVDGYCSMMVSAAMANGTPMKAPGMPHSSAAKNTANTTRNGEIARALPDSRGSR